MMLFDKYSHEALAIRSWLVPALPAGSTQSTLEPHGATWTFQSSACKLNSRAVLFGYSLQGTQPLVWIGSDLRASFDAEGAGQGVWGEVVHGQRQEGDHLEGGMNLQQLRTNVDRKLARYELAGEAVERETKAKYLSESRVTAIQQAQQAVQEIAAQVQQQAHKRIASVATRCLQAVFEEDFELRIHFESKRGKTEARIMIAKDGREMDPLSSCGGGVVDVAAFALRLACLTLRRPQLRRLILADEPCKHLSAAYRPRVRVLLEQLAEELGIQFVLVTHFDDLRCGTVVEL